MNRTTMERTRHCLTMGAAVVAVASVLCGPTVCFAQTFQRVYEIVGNHRTPAIDQTPSGFVIAGFTDALSSGSMVMHRLQTNGNWLAMRTVSSAAGVELATHVLQASDGGFLLVGGTSGGPTTGGDILVVKLDGAANIMWSHTTPGIAFGSDAGPVAREVPAAHGGGYIIVGRVQGQQVPGPLQFQQAPLALRIDAAGNLMWLRHYNDPSLGTALFASAADVRVLPSGNFIVTGYLAEQVFGKRNTLLMELDSSGNIVWQKEYGFDDFTEMAFGVTRASNGDYLVTGFSKQIGEGGGTYLMRTDSLGNLLWRRTYLNFSASGSLEELPGGEIILGGSTAFIGAYASLMLVDSGGSPIWAMAYGDTGSDFGGGLVVLPDGYALAGFTNSFTANFDAYLVRTDLNGRSDCYEFPYDPDPGVETPPVMTPGLVMLARDEYIALASIPGRTNLTQHILCEGGKKELGACCYQIAGTPNFDCIDATEAACDELLNSTFHPGYDCSTLPDECCEQQVLGACCYLDATGNLICEEMTVCECDEMRPVSIFHAGLACDELDERCQPIELGACCYETAGAPGFACTETTEDECEEFFNSTFHPGYDCTTLPDECCIEQVLGACCYVGPDGLPTCEAATECECELIFGSTFHPGIPCSAVGDDCEPIEVGACCYPLTPDVSICADSISFAQCDALNGQFHAGLDCDDPVVLQACELGACCHVDAAGGWTCVDAVSALQCEVMVPSQFYLGLTCDDIIGECPPEPAIGACCVLVETPGGEVFHQCLQLTAAECKEVGGSYLGDGVPCTPNPCPNNCIKPPKGLTGWWTLDDDLSSVWQALDSSGLAAHGFPFGPVLSVPATVDDGMHFNGINTGVRVPSKIWLNVCPANTFCACLFPLPCPMTSFTIDAWIRADALPDPDKIAPIVDKRSAQPLRGYSFFVDENGHLGLMLEDGCGPISTPTLSAVPVITAGSTMHVAVTVSRPFPGTSSVATFYVNGAAVSSHDVSAWPCGMFNNYPLFIGAQVFMNYAPGDGPAHFEGILDEVQIFRRALAPFEIAALYNAGASGKCKHRCAAPVTSICRNHTSKNVNITVCNDSPVPRTYELTFSPLTGGGCQPGLVVPGPQTVTVPALSCQTVTVNMSRPANLASGLTWCYDVSVENLSTGQTTKCSGTLVNYYNLLCNLIVVCCLEAVPVGLPTSIDFEIHPPEPGIPPDPIMETIGWQINVQSSDPAFEALVSLDGLPPGEPVTGSFQVPWKGGGAGNDPVVLSVDVEYIDHAPNEIVHLVLELDAEGDGEYVPVAAVPITSDEPNACAGDLNNDGTVGVSDLLELLSAWGDCPLQVPDCHGDLTSDGAVGVPDLLLLLGNWGACSP